MNKILIANRGEIALRIMRTCEKMGIKSVAIYSEADANAPFVKYADEAVCIGPPPSSQSYLVQEKIIEVALERNVDGIHPGYGFLSENAEFAQKVTKAGIIFIGPSPESMCVMGDKLAAKSAVKGYDIPMVPGVDHAIENVESALKTAKEIGFPILIKAAAGGGGKGMRVVNTEGEFVSQMERAISEAVNAFGNGAVFIEKYIGSPRHIEIQLLADQHGNVVHLFERECSVQRRHQKVIEEAPSSVLSEKLRIEMGEAACKVAQSCNYIGAGTVEFLYDNGLFYFLEMNTRLQVEHPVTEMITGVDLVQEQINIARGQKLSFSQKDLKIKGHSLEVRVYAENPENNFLPDVGNLLVYKRPVGEGIRVDDGLEQGMDIPIFYDPMIAKLIVYGDDRQQAIARMTKAIQDYDIVGVETTLNFCEFAINHEAFVSGDFDTHFVDLHFKNPNKLLSASKDHVEAGVVASYLFATNSSNEKNYFPADYSSWRQKR
ncbi:MAG: acetyl-CoA carboxylase biotin carboxylase subunit [Flavobacteriales bacterium]|jgi:acetyl-CoA carboxylase, biotin carboxylase subunit|nr:acetyl-CoA carboxylase biotin carboxylase subunit [Flavobacteriales bacterium]